MNNIVISALLALLVMPPAYADTELKALPMGGGLVSVPVKPYRKPLPELVRDCERTVRLIELGDKALKELRSFTPAAKKPSINFQFYTEQGAYVDITIDCHDAEDAQSVAKELKDMLEKNKAKLQQRFDSQIAEINKGHG